MAIEDLIKLIEIMDVPYHGKKIESVDMDGKKYEISVGFENGEDIRDELYNLCNSITSTLVRKGIMIDFSDDAEEMDSYHKRYNSLFSLPKEFFIGTNVYNTQAVYSAKVTEEKTVLISLHDANAFIAGYSAKELMQAIYACVNKIKGEEKDEPVAEEL